MESKPRISVVIPTFGREELLCRCLDDVLRQDHPSFEVIVVDQTPRHLPETEAFLRAVKDRVRHVRLERPSLMGALNKGLSLARGEIIWLTDDDVRIEQADLLTRHAEAHHDPSVGGVAGYEHDPRRPTGSQYDPRSADEIWGWYYTTWDHPVRAEVMTAPGANVSFKRAVLVKVGGFDERFTGNAVRWENDVCLRLRRAGYRVVFEPQAIVVHQPATSPGGCENRHHLGSEPSSHEWYASYFRNTAYFALKHMPVVAWPRIGWRVWREHVLNGSYVRLGPAFLLRRHYAFGLGLWRGIVAGWDARQAAKRDGQSREPKASVSGD
jgi:GT2 family glycosyltransferase